MLTRFMDWLRFSGTALSGNPLHEAVVNSPEDELRKLPSRDLVTCILEARRRILDRGKEIDRLHIKIGTIELDHMDVLTGRDAKIQSLQQEIHLWQAAGEHVGLVTPDNLRTWAREVIERNDQFIATRMELLERIRKCRKRVLELSPKTPVKKPARKK